MQAASVSIHGAHGQHIENVHLETYTSPEHWEQLYVERYSNILRKAKAFLDSTGGPGEDVLVFIRSAYTLLIFFRSLWTVSHRIGIVVGWTPRSTRCRQCRDTIGACRRPFFTALRAMHVYLQTSMHVGGC